MHSLFLSFLLFSQDIDYQEVINNPTDPAAHFRLAQKLEGADAIREYESAITLEPGYFPAYVALGKLLDPQKRLKLYLKALSISPDFSLTEPRVVKVNPRRAEENAKAKQAKNLLVYTDTDLPLALMLARFVPSGAHFVVPHELVALFPDAIDDQTLEEALPEHDAKVALSALPHLFGLEAPPLVLHPPQEALKEYAGFVGPHGVGIAWQPLSFEQFTRQLPPGSYYLLEKGPESEHFTALVDESTQVEEVAAAMHDLESVIALPGIVPTLAAALGKPVKILRPADAPWYYEFLNTFSTAPITLIPNISSTHLS